jgi:TRAP-type C4-dicarboxylate transport system permease small subunit
MHLAIHVVVERLRRGTRDFIELCVQLLIFLFAFFVMVIGGFRLVAITLTLNQISAALSIKLGYIYTVLPLSGLAIMFYTFVFFLEKMRTIKGKTFSIPAGSTKDA